MAGHSKWANIKHKKDRTDAKRARVFTRLIKEITVAAKMGGGDMHSNPRLRLAIDKAQDANMPKDNIQRAIDRGTGQSDDTHYEEIRYEGYGIGGVALIVDCLTDNRVRTVADVRHAFSKHGGNMGTDGCVSFQFDDCGRLIFSAEYSEDELMEAALNAGAQDVMGDGEVIEVLTDPQCFVDVKGQLEQQGFQAMHAEVGLRPHHEITLRGEDAIKMQKLLDAFENLDDVQAVYSNAIFDSEES